VRHGPLEENISKKARTPKPPLIWGLNLTDVPYLAKGTLIGAGWGVWNQGSAPRAAGRPGSNRPVDRKPGQTDCYAPGENGLWFVGCGRVLVRA